MQLSLSLDQTELTLLKNQALAGNKRRIANLSKIESSIEAINELLEGDANYSKDMRIKDLESNLVENKISFFLAQSVQDVNNALIEFLDIESERNVLIELEEDLLVNDVYSMLSRVQISPLVCHPSFSDSETFTTTAGINKLNTLPPVGEELRRFYEKVRETSLYSSTGISSADFLAPDTGTIIMRDLQRWRGILTTAPVKHIAIVSAAKSMKFYSILSFLNAIKNINSEYLDTNLLISSSPSRTGDIERILIYGAHGPLSVRVVVVDSDIPNFNGNICDLYPLSLVLDASFPELQYLANSLNVPSINPVTLLSKMSESNAVNQWAVAYAVLERLEQSDLPFPYQIIEAYKSVKSTALKIGNIGDQETDHLAGEVNSLFSTLEVTRKD
jgi:hypothetical protein